jgi:alpha-beta hydrolase superfamily lysophospholipase
MNFLLLRGLSREQRHWGTFRETLAARVPGARVFGLDLPGTGTEFQRASPTDIAGITEDVRARWLDLRAREPGPWCLVAMSLGGMVAMHWCATSPEDFAGVALCNSSAANLSRPWKRMDLRVVPTVVRALFSRDPVRTERLILSMTTRRATGLDAVAAAWASYQADRPVTRATVLRQLWAASRFPAPARLTVPAVILAGAHDPLADPSCQRSLSKHFGVPLMVHPEAGHELALDAPDWFADCIATWLSGLSPSTRKTA